MFFTIHKAMWSIDLHYFFPKSSQARSQVIHRLRNGVCHNARQATPRDGQEDAQEPRKSAACATAAGPPSSSR